MIYHVPGPERAHHCRKSGRIVLLSLAFAGLAVVNAASQEAPAEGSGDTPPLSVAADGIRLNFRGVELDTILDHLSREVGFTIVRDVSVAGRVDVVSHHPLNEAEVVELLNTVLNSKGYAAIRSGRTLTIVSREDAKQRNIPVKVAASPDDIPLSDEMVTQIIPIRHVDAASLLENLTPLLPPYAVASANESSNAIILTDTQANIHRMASIVEALDTSVAGISSVKVFLLQFADAEESATLVTKIFESEAENTNERGQGGGPRFFGRGGFGGGPGGPQEGGDAESPARTAAARVVAVAETRTNSVVVSAPQDMMATITTLIGEIDRVSGGDVRIQVFNLVHAGAEDTAELITGMFEEIDSSDSEQAGPIPRFFPGGGGGPFGGRGGRGGNAESDASTGTADAPVTARADVRTNSVVVSAPAETLAQIAEIIRELDRNPARQRKVFVYSLKNADPESVAAIVQGIFEAESSSSNTTSGSGSTTNTRNSGAGAVTNINNNATNTQSRF